MDKVRVFISTTSDFIKDDPQERKVDWARKLHRELQSDDYDSYLYTEYPEPGKPEEIIRNHIKNTHIFIGIYGPRPGTKNMGGEYIIQWEYNTAEKNHKKIYPFILNPLPHTTDESHKLFLNKLTSFHEKWTSEFRDEYTLISSTKKVIGNLVKFGYAELLRSQMLILNRFIRWLPIVAIFTAIMAVAAFVSLGNLFYLTSLFGVLFMMFCLFILAACMLLAAFCYKSTKNYG